MRLINKLREVQRREGCLSADALMQIARDEKVPLHRLNELVTYYPHLRTEPQRREIAVCRDAPCHLNGCSSHIERIERQWGEDSAVEVRRVSCLGRCEMAPAAAVDGVPVPAAEIGGDLDSVRAKYENALPPSYGPWRLDPYQTPEDRFGALGAVLQSGRDAAADQVIGELDKAGLRGMGGAGFPAGKKWASVRREPRTPKYVICNADESEPGTFKDRAILRETPYLVVEAMIIAGWVVGAQKGIVFLRHEYERELPFIDEAIATVRDRGLLGSDIRGTGFDFDIEVFISPGGYILGEETALLEALEDKRGEPRNKPPYPSSHGLFGYPTVINNVETLAMVPGIVVNGGDWWREQGKSGCAGLKLVSVSGHVERPGVYEIAMGTTVAEVIEMAGGVMGGQKLKAFAPGGASSAFLPADSAGVAIDFKTLADAGSMLGSGGLIVVAEGTNMADLATNLVRFFRNESCGKCVPCRLGTEEAVERLEARLAGTGRDDDLHRLRELGAALEATSICGLGQVALMPVLSAMKHWPQEFDSTA